MNPFSRHSGVRARAGGMLLELVFALALLALVLLPFAGGFVGQRRMARQLSQRLVLTELIDGETELIAAGRWRAFAEGTNSLEIEMPAGFTPPEGRSVVVRSGDSFRILWQPAGKSAAGVIERRWTLPTRHP